MSGHPNVREMRWITVRGTDGEQTIGTMPGGGVWRERADQSWQQMVGTCDARPGTPAALVAYADDLEIGEDARIVARGGWES